MTVTWPAFIQHASDPCLTYVSDQEEWDSDPDLSAWPYEADDRLVDAEGWQYRLLFVGTPGKVRALLEATGDRLGSAEMSELIERHLLAQKGSVLDYRAHVEKRGREEGTRAIVDYLRGR